MSVQTLNRELDRLEGLWTDGLSDSYRSYLDAVAGHEPHAQPKLALAAALTAMNMAPTKARRCTMDGDVMVALLGQIMVARSAAILTRRLC